ncbi:MAG: YidC/Oxa1 family membrane protein insertase [Lachnospirales bacterium]
MFGNLLLNNMGKALLSKSEVIMKDPGFTKFIVDILGVVLDVIYNIVHTIAIPNSLGFSIILFTIFIRVLMVPLAVKQQKSMAKMQEIQPIVKKIQDKYKDNKDPEVQKKMQVEVQKVYSENKVNPLSGCLPLFIQMPIFISLSYIMNNAYMFVNKLGDIYYQLSDIIINATNKATDSAFLEVFVPIANSKLRPGVRIAIDTTDGMAKFLNVFSNDDWLSVTSLFTPETTQSIQTLFTQRESIEMFFGIDLTGVAGLSFPGILIPILAGVSTFLSSYLAMNMNKNTQQNEQMQQQQKIMIIVMPIMMGFMTINLSAGVGLYWITSSIFQVFQQLFLNHNINKKFHLKNYSDESIAHKKEIKEHTKEALEKKLHHKKK